MKLGDKVKIVSSKVLGDMGLKSLRGREAVIEEILDSENRKIKGCWVSLIGNDFKGECEWFVPFCAIKQ